MDTGTAAWGTSRLGVEGTRAQPREKPRCPPPPSAPGLLSKATLVGRVCPMARPPRGPGPWGRVGVLLLRRKTDGAVRWGSHLTHARHVCGRTAHVVIL